jgi:hypothetical protein
LAGAWLWAVASERVTEVNPWTRWSFTAAARAEMSKRIKAAAAAL